MKIGIIDDERPARSELKHQLLQILPQASIVEGDSGARALELAGHESLDIIFLDINLGDINGTILVNALKNMQPGVQIVFVTAYSEYAIQAFELGVDDYVMKPFSEKRLKKVVDRLLEKMRHLEQQNMDPQVKIALSEGPTVNTMQSESNRMIQNADIRRIALNVGTKTVFENIKDIVYIETYNRGCKVYTTEHEYNDSRTIGEYEKKLSHARFFRIHKSYLINIDKVTEVFPWGNNSFCLRMQGYENNILPISREKMKILRQVLES